MGIGKDKENESLTIGKEVFLKMWEGNVFAETTIVEPIVDSSQTAQVLSVQDTQSIRGAFWGSLLNIVALVVTIALAIPTGGASLTFTGLLQGFAAAALNPAVIGIKLGAFTAGLIEGDWNAALSAGISLGFTGAFGTDFFQGILGGLGPLGDVINGVINVGSYLYNGVVGIFEPITSALGGFLTQGFGAIGAKIAETAVQLGVSFGTSYGLESLGVPANISGFLGSLASGAIVGGFNPDGLLTDAEVFKNIQSNVLTTTVLQDVGSLGTELGIDSGLTTLIGLSLGAIQGNLIQNPGTSLEKVFNAIKPNLAQSLSYYGISELGSHLGIDSGILSLAALPISGAIGAGVAGGSNIGSNIIDAINNGLIRGSTNLLINYTGDALGLNPSLRSLSAAVVGGAITGLFGIGQTSPTNPNETVKPTNMFEGISNAFLRGLSNTLTLGSTGDDPWSRASRIQSIANFNDIINEDGLIGAIDSYATGMFQQSAIEDMISVAGSVGSFIEDRLNNQAYVSKIEDGVEYKYIAVTLEEILEGFDPYSEDLTHDYIKVSDEEGRLGVYGFGGEGWASDGVYNLMSDRSLGLSGGYVETVYNGSRYVQRWYEGNVAFTNVVGPDGISGNFYSNADYRDLISGTQGQLIDGTFIDDSDSRITFQGGNITNYNRNISEYGLGNLVTDFVNGLQYVSNTVEGMKQSAGEGALTRLLNDDYKDNADGNLAATFANYVGNKANEYLENQHQVKLDDFERYSSLFGEVGDYIATLYDGYLEAEDFIKSTLIEGTLDLLYFGTEIQSIYDELGQTYHALEAQDYDHAAELMGGIGTRLFREGTRLTGIMTLGMTTMGKTFSKNLTKKLTGKVGALGATKALKFGPHDLVYGPNAGSHTLLDLKNSAGGTLLDDIIKARGGLPQGVGIHDFTKNVLDEAVSNGRLVRFDLTYVNDLKGVLNGTAFTGKVTTTELRHIRSNWDRFKSIVKFYKNGKEFKPLEFGF
jgi:hypothetical protein